MTIEPEPFETAPQNLARALAALAVANRMVPDPFCRAEDLVIDLLHLADACPSLTDQEPETGDGVLAFAVRQYHAERDGSPGIAPVSIRGYTGGPDLPPLPDQALRDAWRNREGGRP